MKRISILTIMLTVAATLCMAQGLVFKKSVSWSEVLREAKASNKYIFIDGHATWCKPCKLMDSEVFPNEEVGQLMNDRFLSIKVQTDQQGSDDALTKGWYADAAMLAKKFNLKALPAQVILSPNGELLYKSFGYQGVQKFIRMIKFSIDPKTANFLGALRNYQAGSKNYGELPELIDMASRLLDDHSIVFSMMRDYLGNYLNKQTDTNFVITKRNIDLIWSKQDALKSSDTFFQIARRMGCSTVDSRTKSSAGSTLGILSAVITKEELEDKLWNDGRILNSKPDWHYFEAIIRNKYPEFDACEIVKKYVNGGLGESCFYRRTGNQEFMDKYMYRLILDYINVDDFLTANNICWFTYFCLIDNRSGLENASRWINDICKRSQASKKVQAEDRAMYYDTKAALLYKLGRRKEAIATELLGIEGIRKDNLNKGQEVNKGCSVYLNVVEQMKRGEKIYLKAGVGNMETDTYPKDWKLLN